MSDENKDNVNEEEVKVDDLEPNADPKGGINVQVGRDTVKRDAFQKVLTKPHFDQKTGKPTP